jgi:LAO/AO transport system kinase
VTELSGLSPSEPGSTPLSTRQLGRAISRLEREPASLAEVLAEHRLNPKQGYRVGLTGPPGVGKSTLVDGLIACARAAGSRVAVLAIDPSSPFSGGALLGDRVRMSRHHADPDVFIRSMAARRTSGGLADSTGEVAALLTAAGFDPVLIETVGVGQGELGVMRAADSVVVVLAPGLGDSVQSLKAGLLEIADLFVVNMADRPEASRAAADLRALQSLGPSVSAWQPPVLLTTANQGLGLQEVWQAVQQHRRYLESSGELALRRRRSAEGAVLERVARRLNTLVARHLAEDERLAARIRAVADGELDPSTAAEEVVAALLVGGDRSRVRAPD